MRCLTSIATLTPCLVQPPVQLGKFADFWGLPMGGGFLPFFHHFSLRKDRFSQKVLLVEKWDQLFWIPCIFYDQIHPFLYENSLFSHVFSIF